MLTMVYCTAVFASRWSRPCKNMEVDQDHRYLQRLGHTNLVMDNAWLHNRIGINVVRCDYSCML